MAQKAKTEEGSEDAIQEQFTVSGSRRVRFSLPPVLSAAASGGASRAGKHVPCDCPRALPMGVPVDCGRVAGHRLQTKRLAKSKFDFPHRVLVCRAANCDDAGPMGMVVAILKPESACFLGAERIAHCPQEIAS